MWWDRDDEQNQERHDFITGISGGSGSFVSWITSHKSAIRPPGGSPILGISWSDVDEWCDKIDRIRSEPKNKRTKVSTRITSI